MQLLQSWRESLSIFKPSNFKLFLLVTLKSIVETYKTLFTKFWWALLIFMMFSVGFWYVHGKLLFLLSFFILNKLVFLCVVFLFFLLARPSVQQKNMDYVFAYKKHFLLFVISPFLFGLLVQILELGLLFVTIASSPILLFGTIIKALLLLLPLILEFIVAFFLDTSGDVGSAIVSLCRGVKLCVFNLPFCLISAGVFYFLLHGIDAVFTPLMRNLDISFAAVSGGEHIMNVILGARSLLSLLVWVIPICFFMNFYVKRLHEQFDLYFAQKGS